MAISIFHSPEWRPSWILAQNEDFPWVDSGGLLFLLKSTLNEGISGEKALLLFLSNLTLKAVARLLA